MKILVWIALVIDVLPLLAWTAATVWFFHKVTSENPTKSMTLGTDFLFVAIGFSPWIVTAFFVGFARYFLRKNRPDIALSFSITPIFIWVVFYKIIVPFFHLGTHH